MLTEKIKYSPSVENFISKMADKDYGMFISAGRPGAGSTECLKQYVRSFPKSVRILIMTDRPADYESVTDTNTVAMMDLSSPRPELLGSNLITEALRLRPSVLIYDCVQHEINADRFSSLCMASVMTNVGLRMNVEKPHEIIRKVERLAGSDKSKVKTSTAISSLKGLILNSHHSEKRVHSCFEMSKDLARVVSSKRDGLSLDIEMDAISRDQGYPSIEDQLVAPKFEMTLAAKLAFENFMKNDKGLAIIGGMTRAGKSTAIRSLSSDYLKSFNDKGYSVVFSSSTTEEGIDYPHNYFSGLINGESYKGEFDAFVGSDLILLDEIETVDQILNAIELSKSTKVVAVLNSNSHYTNLISLSNISTFEEISDSLKLSIMASKDNKEAQKFNLQPLVLDSTDREVFLQSLLNKSTKEQIDLIEKFLKKQGF